MRTSVRIIIKIGSSSLVDSRGVRQIALLATLVEQTARLVEAGHEVAIVSSGAIATGLGVLGRKQRPSDLPSLQAASAVGQGALFKTWSELFSLRQKHAAQVLLTMHDAAQRATWRNARTTLEQLLRWGVIPIINENDTTATDEISFGDNDALAAQVAVALRADLLILLTDTDGLYTAHPSRPNAELIEELTDFSLLETIELDSCVSQWGSGGMRSKVISAKMASSGGVPTRIAKAYCENVLLRIVEGEALGTKIAPHAIRESSFQVWLRHAKKVRGTITVDSGAYEAITSRGASLLAVGVIAVSGAFEPGDAVEVVADCSEKDEQVSASAAQSFARGIVQYTTSELAALIGNADKARGGVEVIHRDQLIII